MHRGQRPADEILLGAVLPGERLAGHPGQQRQPGVTNVHRQLPVRGLGRVRAVVLWFALAHNLLRSVALRRAAAQVMAGS